MPWPSRTGRGWSIIAAGALTAAWVFAPAAVPMYDSCCTPDEPYRYVKAPTGYRSTPAPSVGRAIVHTPDRHTRPGFVNTAEVGPQASLFVPAGALDLPQRTRELILTVTPEAPPANPPPQGLVAGNVYRVAAVADSRPVALRANSDRPALQLRAPSSKQPGPVFEFHDSTGWHRDVRTTRTGLDIYQTEINTLGDWALVQLKAPTSSGGSGVDVGLLGAGLAVLIITGAVVLIRQRRSEGSR